MRNLFLVTGSNEVKKYVECLDNLKLGETASMQYDLPGMHEGALYAQIKDWKPDFIAYIGSRWGTQPSPAMLSQINAHVAPMVHICSDAADTPWHDLLRVYNESSSFSLQVAIDGSYKWPNSNQGLTALTPVDLGLFAGEPRAHAARNVICGYAGNPGSGNGSKRTGMLSSLLERKVIDALHTRSGLPYTNHLYCAFLSNSRISVNIAWSGTEQALHVKGRVVESALAGSLLLETKGSPTSHWFRPGLDYLEYDTADEAADIVRRLSHEPEATQEMALSLRRRVLDQHTPAHFWKRIFDKIGLNVAV